MTKLIKFVVQDIEVKDFKGRKYVVIERKNDLPLMMNEGELPKIGLESVVTKVEYDRFYLHDGHNLHEYFINFENSMLIMPILDAIIKNRTEKFEKRISDLVIESASQSAKIKKYESLLPVKIFNWLRLRITL